MIFQTEIVDGVAVITFDLPGSPVNTFSRAVREAFPGVIAAIEQDASVRAAVLISGKRDSFIAGADIEEFLEIRAASEAEALSRGGHAMLERLEQLRLPVVAAIHGSCLGGGLELALACRYRIATDHKKTVLALPEVQLGILPGGGGTQRLPRLIGLRGALDMMLTGKNIRARKALTLGLVDEVVHPSLLRSLAIARANELADGRRRPVRHSRGAGAMLLEGNPVGRSVVFRKARESVMAKTKGSYPAPLAILDAVAAGYQDVEEGYRLEARLFGELTQTDVSRQLVFLFFATTALKKDTGVSGDAPAPVPITKIGMLGTGFMGAGIAAVTAMQGIGVRFKDTAHERVLAGLRAVREVLKERLTKKQITRQEFSDQLTLVQGTTDYSGFGNAPLVIEAVFEELSVKHAVLAELEQVVAPHAIIASNTSTIPITSIAAAAQHPERVLGMHFFSPVHKMPLLEVIVTAATSPQAITTAVAYGKRIGKTIIVVNDGPGFYVNRILAPYISEAGRLLDEGVGIEAIDAALTQFGFPVGPITLLDEVGLDIAGKSGRIMLDAFGARFAPSQSLQAIVTAGRLGRKAKSGFYTYDDAGKKGGVDESIYDLLPSGKVRVQMPAAEIVQRCVLPMINEAVQCLADGIVRSARDGDVGAVFGIGFPPFRGGPFRYADTLGTSALLTQLDELRGRFPERYTPSDLLVDMGRRGGRFYPAHGKPVG